SNREGQRARDTQAKIRVTFAATPGRLEHMFDADGPVVSSGPSVPGLERFQDDPSDLSDECLEAGFADLVRLCEAAEAKRLVWLGELERRKAWRRDGYL